MAHTCGEAGEHKKSGKTVNTESGKKDPEKREEYKSAAKSPILCDKLNDVVVRILIYSSSDPASIFTIRVMVNLWIITLIHGKYIAK